MGGSLYSSVDYTARQTYRAKTGQTAFVHQQNISSGKVAASVDPALDPFGVKMREARDSDAHPVSLPIGVILDMTGSMQQVPRIVQGSLNKLMGTFLDQKASGKKYLGDAYPAILIGAVDDYFAQSRYGGKGSLQVGQFESGLEIDDNLGKLWFTGNGGGNGGESYDLPLYFFARHTAHDHFDKRGRKGYLFIIGDEPYFKEVSGDSITDIIGKADGVSNRNIPIEQIVGEVQQRYHVYFIMPNLTDHWGDKHVEGVWKKLLGEEHFIRLGDPNEICTLIASLVAMNEGHANMQDLAADGVVASVTQALAVVPQGQAVSTIDASGLPAINGPRGTTKRL